MNPFEHLEQFYPEVIAQMPVHFDSHKFILQLAQQHQALYVQALAQYPDEPFRIVHGELSKRLKKFSHLIRQDGVKNSPDIFGEVCEAAAWEKVS
jgi:hypothetical protein